MIELLNWSLKLHQSTVLVLHSPLPAPPVPATKRASLLFSRYRIHFLLVCGGLLSGSPVLSAPLTSAASLPSHHYTAADLTPRPVPETLPTSTVTSWTDNLIGNVPGAIAESVPPVLPPAAPFSQIPAPVLPNSNQPPPLPPVLSSPQIPGQNPDLPSIPVPGERLPPPQSIPPTQILSPESLPVPPDTPPSTSPPRGPASPLGPSTSCDPELGCLRLKPAPLPLPTLPKTPVAYLRAQLDYYRSSNIFAGIDPVNDGFVRPSVTFSFNPPLGPRTFLTTSVLGSLFRYSDQTVSNLDELQVSAALVQRVSPVMFVGLGWMNQKYRYGSDIPLEVDIAGNITRTIPAGTRFFNENSVRLEISRRDRLSPKLSLSTFYQLRLIFAQPFSTRPFYSDGLRDLLGTTEDRSRVLNTLVTSLTYDLSPNLQAGLDYQLAIANFTQQNRDDIYHQVSASINYMASRNTQLRIYGGASFGESSRSDINFNGFILGVSVSVNLALF